MSILKRKNDELEGKVVVVTGATAGVGRAVVREMAARGANIGLLARGRDGLQATCEEVQNLGRRALALQADVSDYSQVEAAADAVERELGPIDIWVNNAMVTVFSRIKDMEASDFQRVTDVTYLGNVNGSMAALKRMLPRDNGTIVQVGSALAFRGIPLQAPYCGAKHAIKGFTDSLRCELLHDGSHVRVTEVHLPAMNTPQFEWLKSRLPHKAQPVPPIFQPEVAARAIVWAATHNRRGLLVGWPTIASVFANKIAPGLLDHYLAKTGFASQQTDEPEDDQRGSNLYEPWQGDWGARGTFDRRAKTNSPTLWASIHRGWLSGLILVGGLSMILATKAAGHD